MVFWCPGLFLCAQFSSLFVTPFSVPDIPVGIGVHWDGNHNFCLYLLNRSLNEKAGKEVLLSVAEHSVGSGECSVTCGCHSARSS